MFCIVVGEDISRSCKFLAGQKDNLAFQDLKLQLFNYVY